jgi:hypothetical protein
MQARAIRRSDRVSLQLPLLVSGTSALGRESTISTKALVLSRHGVNILLDRELMPEAPLTVRCLETNKEAEASYAGSMREVSEGASIGLKFLDESVNLWNIDFPPLSESANAVARLLLECPSCHALEISYLNEVEALAFEINGYVPRPCTYCAAPRKWKKPERPILRKQILKTTGHWIDQTSSPESTLVGRDEINPLTLRLQFTVCIRSHRMSEEVSTTEKVSRNGFSFKSRRQYAVGDLVEVAVPYISESGNIFFPARVKDIQDTLQSDTIQCSLSYIPAHAGWPEAAVET